MQLLSSNELTDLRRTGTRVKHVYLDLAPHNSALTAGKHRGISMCPSSSSGCRELCSKLRPHGETTSALGCFNRITFPLAAKRTQWLVDNPKQFLAQLHNELREFQASSWLNGFKLIVTLNRASDVRWEDYGVPQLFPELTVFNQTMIPDRIVPDNHHLVFSRNESNEDTVMATLRNDRPVTVIFVDDVPDHVGHNTYRTLISLPRRWGGFEVRSDFSVLDLVSTGKKSNRRAFVIPQIGWANSTMMKARMIETGFAVVIGKEPGESPTPARS